MARVRGWEAEWVAVPHAHNNNKGKRANLQRWLAGWPANNTAPSLVYPPRPPHPDIPRVPPQRLRAAAAACATCVPRILAMSTTLAPNGTEIEDWFELSTAAGRPYRYSRHWGVVEWLDGLPPPEPVAVKDWRAFAVVALLRCWLEAVPNSSARAQSISARLLVSPRLLGGAVVRAANPRARLTPPPGRLQAVRTITSARPRGSFPRSFRSWARKSAACSACCRKS
jgi:hypothetical protein